MADNITGSYFTDETNKPQRLDGGESSYGKGCRREMYAAGTPENAAGNRASGSSQNSFPTNNSTASAANPGTGSTGEQLAGNPEDVDQMSFQAVLAEGIGVYVVCEFLIGVSLIVRRAGILERVGVSYFTLYEEFSDTYIVCDLYSLKFVTFFRPGVRPENLPAQPQAITMMGPYYDEQQVNAASNTRQGRTGETGGRVNSSVSQAQSTQSVCPQGQETNTRYQRSRCTRR